MRIAIAFALLVAGAAGAAAQMWNEDIPTAPDRI
jgi:hypothetical protein